METKWWLSKICLSAVLDLIFVSFIQENRSNRNLSLVLNIRDKVVVENGCNDFDLTLFFVQHTPEKVIGYFYLSFAFYKYNGSGLESQAIRRKKFSIFALKINVVIGSKSLDFHATSKGLEFRF